MTDFLTISSDDLDKKNRERSHTKNREKRCIQISNEYASEYKTYSYRSIRSTLNCHFQDLGRDIDIVHDTECRQYFRWKIEKQCAGGIGAAD